VPSLTQDISLRKGYARGKGIGKSASRRLICDER